MYNYTFEDVTISIPAGTVLTASKGAFLFRSALTEGYHACKKIEYLGDGRWKRLDEKIEMDVTKTIGKGEDE